MDVVKWGGGGKSYKPFFFFLTKKWKVLSFVFVLPIWKSVSKVRVSAGWPCFVGGKIVLDVRDVLGRGGFCEEVWLGTVREVGRELMDEDATVMGTQSSPWQPQEKPPSLPHHVQQTHTHCPAGRPVYSNQTPVSNSDLNVKGENEKQNLLLGQ